MASYFWSTKRDASLGLEPIAQTRDVFRARLDRFYKELVGSSWHEADSALLTAVPDSANRKNLPGTWALLLGENHED